MDRHTVAAISMSAFVMFWFPCLPAVSASTPEEDLTTSGAVFDGVDEFTDYPVIANEETVYVEWKQYITGFPDQTFRPENPVTRAQIAAMLYRNLYDEDLPVSTGLPDDVDEHLWYSEAVAFVISEGLMIGNPSGLFLPDSSMTRAEFSTVIARYRELELSDDDSSFDDVTGHWAEREITAVYQAGIVKGFPSGLFMPDDPVTRAQSVTMINRMFNRGPLQGLTGPSFTDVPSDYWAFDDIEAALRNYLEPLNGEDLGQTENTP